MRRQLVVSRDAETDLILIWVYYAEKSEQAAKRIREEIIHQYNLLVEYPFLGRSREELQVGLRSMPVANHVVFYRVTDSAIEIVRVLHGAQDVDATFPPEDAEFE